MAARKQSTLQSAMSGKQVTRKQYIKLVDRFGLFIALGFLASFAVFVVVAWFGGVSSVLHILSSINPRIYILAFICVFASYVVRFFKWDYLTKELGLIVPKTKNFLIYLSTNAMNITPGGVGSIVAAYSLKKVTNKKFIDIVPIITIDLFTDFFGFAIFALAVSLYIGRYVIYVVILDMILVVPYLFILSPWIFNKIKEKKKKGFITKKILKYGGRYYIAQNKMNRPKTYFVSLLYTLPADFLNSMALYFSLLAVGIKPKILFSTFIFSVAQITGMISTLPGGVGAADATFVALLKAQLGLTSTLSSAITIMTRLVYLWFGVGVGIIALVWTLKYWKDSKKKGN